MSRIALKSMGRGDYFDRSIQTSCVEIIGVSVGMSILLLLYHLRLVAYNSSRILSCFKLPKTT